MLLSMTGYGAGQADQNGTTVAVEIRTVNNRYLKVYTRLTDGYAVFEPRLEEVVRKQIRRGSVQLNVDIRKATTVEDYHINRELIESYYRQLRELQQKLGEQCPIGLANLLGLPGAVLDTPGTRHADDDDWCLIERATEAALLELGRMREAEGTAMSDDLHAQLSEIACSADEIAQRAPQVVDAYQNRLTERINKLLAQHDVEVQPADVVREVGIFAERSDISEEIVRLRSHLDQFSRIMQERDTGGGRKLDFLVQELLRETNTIGSKANDAEIANQVIHAKTCIERIREMVQNVE